MIKYYIFVAINEEIILLLTFQWWQQMAN